MTGCVSFSSWKLVYACRIDSPNAFVSLSVLTQVQVVSVKKDSKVRLSNDTYTKGKCHSFWPRACYHAV